MRRITITARQAGMLPLADQEAIKAWLTTHGVLPQDCRSIELTTDGKASVNVFRRVGGRIAYKYGVAMGVVEPVVQRRSLTVVAPFPNIAIIKEKHDAPWERAATEQIASDIISMGGLG